MNGSTMRISRIVLGLVLLCCCGMLASRPAAAAPDIPQDFDAKGEKIFLRYDETPLGAMSGTDGQRNLNAFYGLRQYPGSPPRIPHKVADSFAGEPPDCLACHGRGGYDAEQEAFVPMTPHPENELCYQCHVPILTETLLVESVWQSIDPPRLGRSQLASSPPPIPHGLQLREDCIACHTGPAAVAEIRVEHGSRGNCRQCHVPLPATEPVMEYTRSTPRGSP